ncbi:epoxide hydrolase family protein [Aeromicrobium sp. UC242_57]|uniref:epoxide hydrolase family protein n=1 Tax=Aeromicrobium sp. UC242_57 TaxID=3374624 RepID=UPI0037BDE8D2
MDQPTNSIMPFEVSLSDEAIGDLRARVARTRWSDQETVTDWSQGVPLDYLRELTEYWVTEYDFSRLATRFNQFDQVMTSIGGTDIHALHVRSPEPHAQPLLLTHGWPGSVVEFLDIIPLLTDPVAHGGDASDAFHVVCPSLPGYGFSGKPDQTGWGLARVGEAWLELMTRLGYDRFGLQGGGWGSMVSIKVAQLAPARITGVHLNLGVASPDALLELGDLTDVETEYLGRFQYYADNEGGYSTIQGTRPQTLGYALVDSPVGQCAWIVEKFHGWTENDGSPESAVPRDVILDNVSLYWLTASATSAGRLYWEGYPASLTDFSPTEVPVGYTVFPRDLFALSERWALTRFPNLQYYSIAKHGGHFAALEEPGAFVDEVRRSFQAFREA